MAFLKDALHDVFLSYAHVDNIPDREGEKGWVDDFKSQLSVRLLKRFGERIEVWSDPKLRRAELYDKVIERAVRDSGMMLALITSSYLKSDYCRMEMEWFRTKAEAEPAGLVVGDSVRIFPVLLYNIPPSEWPQACHGTSAFRFHEAIDDDDYGRPLDPASPRFRGQLHHLVEDIHTVLTRLRSREPDERVEPGSFRAFFSQPPDDQRPTKRQLAAALKDEGIDVLTDIPPPYDDEGHAGAVREALRQADLSIHLLSASPGEPVDAEQPGRTYPVEQVKIGLDHARSQLILLPQELDLSLVDDASYAEFLESLVQKKRDADRLELVQTTRHRMLDEILAKRRRIEEARARQAAVSGAGLTAFIDLHTKDLPAATDLVGYLSERKFNPLMVPSADLSPTMSLFEDYLRKARLFIVVFGTVAREWVQHRLLEANKLILVNELPTLVGVYVGPPDKPREHVDFACEVAMNSDRFDPQTVERLLQKVTSATT